MTWILNAMCMFIYLFVVYFSFAPVISAITHRYCELFYIQVLMMVIKTETLTSTSHHDIFTYLDYIFSCYLHTVGFYPYLLSYIYIYILYHTHIHIHSHTHTHTHIYIYIYIYIYRQVLLNTTYCCFLCPSSEVVRVFLLFIVFPGRCGGEKQTIWAQALSTVSLVIFGVRVELFVVWKIVSKL